MITKTCSVSGQPFIVTDEDLKFYEKMGVPVPTLCPEERARRRLALRNERNLYWRKCDATGNKILSVYSTEKVYPVYENDYWWSDKWDPTSYGRVFDFNRPFFKQFGDLQDEVPMLSLNVITPTIENSKYVNQVTIAKDCYLIFNSHTNENCMYGACYARCFDCLDCLNAYESEGCYQCISIHGCHSCTYVIDSQNCYDCHLCSSLIGCKNCFGCVNLRNKEFYFLNKPYSQEEYIKKVKDFRKKYSSSQALEHFSNFRKTVPQKWMVEKNTQDCTGDYLVNSKKCHQCYESEDLEDCAYCSDLKKGSEANFQCYDVNFFGAGIKHCYESVSIGNTSEQLMCCENTYYAHEITYSRLCPHSSNCFGCLSVKKGKYCILNKSYTTHEYETLKDKIIAHMKETGEWGEFFPISLSPFAYNETVAQEYFPLTKEEALEKGYKWRDELNPSPQPPSLIKEGGDVIPENISDVPDSITEQVLYCEKSGKPYKIQKAELKFYRKMNLPIPRLHPDIRHQERMKLRNPRKLWSRKCSECEKEIQTTYAPERPEKVLCEGCYLKVVN